MNPIEGVDRFAVACAPIMADGDVNGAVIMLSDKDNSAVDEKQRLLLKQPQCISENRWKMSEKCTHRRNYRLWV